MPPTTRGDLKGTGYQWLAWVTPNQLTIGRILVVPVVVLLIYLGGPMANTLAWVCFTMAAVTDYLDGDLARYRGEVTLLGRMLDPLADKMLISASLIMLVAQDHAAAVPTILIILREFAVTGLRQVAALDGAEIHVADGGKLKTVLQMLATGGLILNHDPFGLPMAALGSIALWIAMVVTLWTGYLYFSAFFKHKPDDG